MKYEVLMGITIKDKYYEAGSIMSASELPNKSIKWLLEQNYIVKMDKQYQEKKMQELQNAKAEEE